MACNSIAFSAATVSISDQVFTLLGQDLVVDLVKIYLEQQHQVNVNVIRLGTITKLEAPDFSVNIGLAGLQVASYWAGSVQTDSLAAELGVMLDQAAGIILQEQIAEQIRGMGWVESDMTNQAGTRVITLEV